MPEHLLVACRQSSVLIRVPASVRLPLRIGVAVALAATALAAAFTAPAAHAQYKWIDAEGRVNYGDQPPPSDRRHLVRAPLGVHPSEAPAAGDHRLPYALRAATARHPVVLYTTPDCAPCDLARDHLAQRGVPFTERPVRSAADLRAFNALQPGTTQFPLLTVGTDRMAGFEATQWNRMLDAAAYPRASMLPANVAAGTLEPLSPPERQAMAGDETGRQRAAPTAPTAQDGRPARTVRSGTAAGGAPLPAQPQQIVNPIRF